MANVLQPIGTDASGYEVLTAAIQELLNQYPGLPQGERIKFEELEKDKGIAFSADSGALIYEENEDVIGNIFQTCQFPFYVVYRTASDRERRKLSAQSFLDGLGKWLRREKVVLNDKEYRLTEYPKLSQERKITRIVRENAYGLEPQENGVQDWVLPVSVRYSNEILEPDA